ncbi:hypothetical protein GCM10029992_40280 [Glycomyces albus]
MGTETVGIFGAVGRETKGALRSVGYDLRHSKRFRRIGVLTVAGVAGGVLAAGTLLRGPVPEMMGVGSGQDESGITDGWWGFDSDTQTQDAEPDEDPSGGPGGSDSPRTAGDQTSAPPGDDDRPESGGSKPSNPLTPGLDPVESPGGSTPSEENSPTESDEPDPEPTATTDPEPSDEPTDEPGDDPTPSDEPSPSDTGGSPSGTPQPDPSS